MVNKIEIKLVHPENHKVLTLFAVRVKSKSHPYLSLIVYKDAITSKFVVRDKFTWLAFGDGMKPQEAIEASERCLSAKSLDDIVKMLRKEYDNITKTTKINYASIEKYIDDIVWLYS